MTSSECKRRLRPIRSDLHAKNQFSVFETKEEIQSRFQQSFGYEGYMGVSLNGGTPKTSQNDNF